MSDSNLIVKISAEAKDFNDKVDDIKNKTGDLEDALAGVAKISGALFAGLVASAGIAVKAFAESEKATKELTLALQNQGIASDKTVQGYRDIANELSRLTGIDDDAIVAGEAVLQTFLGQTEITPQLAAAMADLSEKTGSVESAAQILGRGIAGNTRGLKQFGIAIDESLTKEERLAAITEQVSQKFGGLAEANNKGLGSFRGLQTAVGNFLENVGERLAPVVTQAVQALTNFFNTLNDNEALLDVIVEVGKIVGLIAGLITGVAVAAIGIIKFQNALLIAGEAMKILGLSTRALVGATGIGLLLIIAAEIYLNWNKIWPAMQAVYQTFAENVAEIASGLGDIITAVLFPSAQSISKIKSGYEKLKGVVQEGIDNIKNASASEGADSEKQIQQIESKKNAAVKANTEIAASEALKREVIAAENEALTLQLEAGSAQQVELKRKEIELLKQLEDEKYRGQRDLLREHLDEVRLLQQEATADQEARETAFGELQIQKQATQFGLTQAQTDAFLLKKQSGLIASIETENTTRQKAFLDQTAKQIAANNQFLAEQQRYGTAFATINQALNSTQVQGVQQTTSQLVGLQNSRNSTLQAVGKAAAVTDITIKTAQAAVSAYQGFLQAIPYPPVAIPLGIAAAAGVIAYGADQIGRVLGAQDGGVVPGFNTGGDSVPSVLQAGELVVPRASFDEVVNAVASQRVAESPEASSGVALGGGGGGTSVKVELGFSGDNAEKFLTARQVEARSLGTLRESTA